MNKYEMMFIVKANADEKAVANTAKSLKDIITSMKGKIENEQDLGSKELAYPIKKENVGYYFVVNFEATAERTVLSGNPDFENNYDRQLVKPKTDNMSVQKKMTIDVPANSFTMIKVTLK